MHIQSIAYPEQGKCLKKHLELCAYGLYVYWQPWFKIMKMFLLLLWLLSVDIIFQESAT